MKHLHLAQPPTATSALAGALILAAGLVLSGCGETHSAPAGEPVVVGPQYSASKGLFVPEETRQALALRTVDVGEQTLTRGFTLPLRVYETRDGTVHATGVLPADQARQLRVGQAVAIEQATGASVLDVRPQTPAPAAPWEVLVTMPTGSGAEVGAFLTGRVNTGAVGNALTVPRSAVLEAFDGTYVYATSGEYFVRTPVKVGATSEASVEITDGLYAGDVVVTEPVMALWLTELAAIKGGHSCCVVPPKEK